LYETLLYTLLGRQVPGLEVGVKRSAKVDLFTP
jgi:hypothetical protein